MAKRTTFFDLPLEIRQQIYNECLPWDRMITYDPAIRSLDDELLAQQKASSSVWSLWACGGALQEEVQNWMLKTCGARLVVSPDMDELPKNLPIGRFSMIEILVDYYDKSTDEQQSIQDLCVSMMQVVQFLINSAKVETNPPLNLEVRFRDAGYDVDRTYRTTDDNFETDYYGDEHWCEPESLGQLETREGCLLGASGTGMSIVECIIEPLRYLPVCNVCFHELLGVQYVHAQDRASETVDYDGMLAMFEAFHQYIAGNRQMGLKHLRHTYRLKLEMDRWSMDEITNQIYGIDT